MDAEELTSDAAAGVVHRLLREHRGGAPSVMSTSPDDELSRPQRLRELISPDEFAWLRQVLKLSTREAQYLDLAVADPRDGVVAAEMGVSIHTAHTHRVRLFRKAGADGMARLLTVVFSVLLTLRRDAKDNPEWPRVPSTGDNWFGELTK
jgi:DNA-binding CsgD family transcriptional regulator